MKSRSLILTCIAILLAGFAHGQTTAITSGGEASGSGGAVSYTIGQVACQASSGTTGSVSEGIQQPYEISTVTGIEETKGINLSVSVYPNPTTNFITLEVNEFELSNLNFHLYDMQGNLLQNRKITGSRTSIVMGNLVPATYFITVMQNNKKVKSFKIIKN